MADSIPVITGATATGKTAAAVALARLMDGEVISMDSRQVYAGMDIGTAKPTLAERRGVPHHGFDVVAPHERYSAGRFARDARQWIAEIRARNRTPILAGGTGFFLRALMEPLFEEPLMDTDRRERLKAWLAGWPVDELARWADALERAGVMDAAPGDRQRLARRIEIALLTGRPLSQWQREAAAREPGLPLRVFVLDVPVEILDERIDARVHDMIAAGLVEEVEALATRGMRAGAPGMSATGYSEILDHLAAGSTIEEAVARIQLATRQYARRQRTWLRGQLPAAVRLDATRAPGEVAADIIERLATREAGV
jgi:tRNA dimethylallyltransferase